LASILKHIPGIGLVDPTSIQNANYEFKQAVVDTSDNSLTVLYADPISEAGVYLYEVRIVGIESVTSNAVFKRSFTAYKTDTSLTILTPQSDYTQKTNPAWNVAITSDSNNVLINVMGSESANIHWVTSITKTMGF
jgi:hypothetical protein